MLKKIVKLLVILIIVMLIVTYLAEKNLPTSKPMYERVDNSSTLELSMNDYYTLKESAFTRYFGFIQAKDYKNAYDMLTGDYRAYKSYEDFTIEVKNKDFSDPIIKSIELKNANIYVSRVILGELEETYFIFTDDIGNTFNLSPEGVLEYKEIKEGKIKEKNLDININNYVAKNDKLIINLTMKNNSSNENATIKNIKMFSIEDFEYNMLNEEIIIAPGQEVTANIEYETKYKFPKQIIIIQDGNMEKSFDILGARN